MPRRPSPERQAEYQELKLFLLTLYEFFDRWAEAQPQKPPFAMLPLLRQSIETAEMQTFSAALRGMRMAVNESLEMTIHFDQETVRQADDFLVRKGCKTLTWMRNEAGQTFCEILRRGRIRNDEEYHLMVLRLNAASETALQGADREMAARMVAAYECGRSVR
ncbi:MAG: hypothetical protein QUS33_12070 [Dehalococcoidia bacterium]|nr:hypothetical protein [Dehalococcoidia bacterium]